MTIEPPEGLPSESITDPLNAWIAEHGQPVYYPLIEDALRDLSRETESDDWRVR